MEGGLLLGLELLVTDIALRVIVWLVAVGVTVIITVGVARLVQGLHSEGKHLQEVPAVSLGLS